MAGPISSAAVSPGLPVTGAQNAATDLWRAKAKDAAQKFESQFLAQMIGQMFEGIETDGPFGGGEPVAGGVVVEARDRLFEMVQRL